jgi:arabinan endo-1,5-alpha-L-arabinosidase
MTIESPDRQQQQAQPQERCAAEELMYQNPVWPGYFADPFVLRYRNEYYVYGTGPAGEDRRPFPLLKSCDLVNWEPLGGALEAPKNFQAHAFWAPEVAEKDGRFYMYYSASTTPSDDSHRLRVAVADHPAGPFHDSGRVLMPEGGFAIDASPFRDPKDGRYYLFFATDYESDEPHGTGLAVVPICDDMVTITAERRLVTRASAAWQVYEKNRNYKNRVWAAWYCVEGPCAMYHDGRYYCFYSGGAWHGPNYGVGFAVADHPLGPWRDDFAVHGPTVLKGIPGKVIGPGHNSVVLGPDGRTWFMVYHAWDGARTARRMCIDPIYWTKEGNPKVEGPSTEPRPLFKEGIQ